MHNGQGFSPIDFSSLAANFYIIDVGVGIVLLVLLLAVASTARWLRTSRAGGEDNLDAIYRVVRTLHQKVATIEQLQNQLLMTRMLRKSLDSESFADWFNHAGAGWEDHLPWDLRSTKANFQNPDAMAKNPSAIEPLVPANLGEFMVFESDGLKNQAYLTPALDLRRPWPNTLLKRWSRFFDFECAEPRKLDRAALVRLTHGRYELLAKGRLIG